MSAVYRASRRRRRVEGDVKASVSGRRRVIGAVAGLFLAGITGNLVDRIFQPPAALHGHVIDMFSLRGFAIFNVADSAVVVGGILLVLSAGFGGRDRETDVDDVEETDEVGARDGTGGAADLSGSVTVDGEAGDGRHTEQPR